MQVDMLTWLSENIGPVAFGLSGVASVSTGAFAYLIYRRRHELERIDLLSLIPKWNERDIVRLLGVTRGFPVRYADESALLDAIIRVSSFKQPTPLALPEGDIVLSRSLGVTAGTRLVGRGTDVTRLQAPRDQAVVSASGVKDCALCNLGLDGGIECANSEMVVRDCEVTATHNQAGIDATERSIVTFSGRIKTEPGGVAIRARSGSKVILEAPFEIQPQDQVIMEPGSEILC